MRRWLALFALTVAIPAHAGEVAASSPADVSVTIYRDPNRNGGSIELDALDGFAVITETRTVTLPAGQSHLRFEGVVDGIIAESAIIRGLPGGVIEKNRDAALLSPSALLRAGVGHDLTLKRTNPRTGKITLTPATLVSASDQGVVFKTAGGEEALRCSGLPETFRYSTGAQGLSAKPTLSVLTRTRHAITATVTLTYIAQGFDWSAAYTAHINPDGKTMDVGGWITLANGNSVGLENARTQIVAGGLNREYVRRFTNNQARAVAKCWPVQRTSDVPRKPERPYQLVRPWLGNEVADEEYDVAGDIIVSAQRRKGVRMEMAMPMTAVMAAPAPPPPPEQLGDLKLYRVPQRTTVAAMQMKQTRLIEQQGVPFERIYTLTLPPGGYGETRNNAIAILRTRNDKAHQLGLPLPSGAFIVEQDQLNRTMLVGQPALRDTAEDEKVELTLGPAPDVTAMYKVLRRGRKFSDSQVEITNASDHAIAFELRLQTWGSQKVSSEGKPVDKEDGQPIFHLTVPANGTKTVPFTVRDN